MNTAGEIAIGCLAIAVFSGVARAIDNWRRYELPTDRDWGFEMQAAAELHLELCNDALFEEEAGVDSNSPAIAPYCGCHTCTVREVLVAAWPVMQEMILNVSHRPDITFELRTHPGE